MKINGYESNIQISQELGERIKSQRIDMNLTQEQLSLKAGVSLRTINNVENGKDVKFSILLNVLRVLGLISNIDILVPETIIRPYDYLELNKKRERVRKSIVRDSGFKWGDEK